MHYRRLGRSGLKVSEISLGSWVTFGNQIEEQAAIDLIRAAYEEGVNFFDNADMYSNGQAEVVMGKAIRDLPREALVLSSKVFWPTMPGPNGRGLSRKHILESAHASLRRMGVDYLDLYFCHRFDLDTPIEEVVWVMNDLIQDVSIDGKHSYEDAIIPVEEFQARFGGRYGSDAASGRRIACLGGIDLNILAAGTPEQVRQRTRTLVVTCGGRGRYAIGSGNSIPSYVPVDNYLAMVDEALTLQ